MFEKKYEASPTSSFRINCIAAPRTAQGVDTFSENGKELPAEVKSSLGWNAALVYLIICLTCPVRLASAAQLGLAEVPQRREGGATQLTAG
mmetsp:Transcript_65697/g.117096  ORF Transcript_65697/g.117096 Transcript_65697/m.117096 type:complete len:91 (+) Transcript_65697:1101-1373(+)